MCFKSKYFLKVNIFFIILGNNFKIEMFIFYLYSFLEQIIVKKIYHYHMQRVKIKQLVAGRPDFDTHDSTCVNGEAIGGHSGHRHGRRRQEDLHTGVWVHLIELRSKIIISIQSSEGIHQNSWTKKRWMEYLCTVDKTRTITL